MHFPCHDTELISAMLGEVPCQAQVSGLSPCITEPLVLCSL